MSGMQVLYNLSKPSWERVVKAQVLCTKCHDPSFENIDLNKTYKILMQSFMAEGGDGYTMFVGKTVKTFNASDLDVFSYYLEKKSPIYPAVEWRVTFTSDEGEQTTIAPETSSSIDPETSSSSPETSSSVASETSSSSTASSESTVSTTTISTSTEPGGSSTLHVSLSLLVISILISFRGN